MSDAIASYHDLLASGATLAADSQAVLENAQRLRGLHFGARPLCTVLRPRFLTPHQYRLLRKIELAKGLLVASGESVTGIARRLGYRDAFYFCRQFKRFTGLSPGQFRAVH